MTQGMQATSVTGCSASPGADPFGDPACSFDYATAVMLDKAIRQRIVQGRLFTSGKRRRPVEVDVGNPRRKLRSGPAESRTGNESDACIFEEPVAEGLARSNTPGSQVVRNRRKVREQVKGALWILNMHARLD